MAEGFSLKVGRRELLQVSVAVGVLDGLPQASARSQQPAAAASQSASVMPTRLRVNGHEHRLELHTHESSGRVARASPGEGTAGVPTPLMHFPLRLPPSLRLSGYVCSAASDVPRYRNG